MINYTIKEEEQGYSSDSTLTAPSSVDLFTKRPSSATQANNRKRPKRISGVPVPKKSLTHFLETKTLFRKKPLTKSTLSPGRNVFKSPKKVLPTSKGDGDYIRNRNTENKENYLQSALTVGNATVPSEPKGFPFTSTPSGHYKLRPSQVVYESKNLSIVAADPTNVSLNITESEALKAEQDKNPLFDNWPTTCLYTTVGKGDLTYSDIDTTSDSDHGKHVSELSLAKMGYVTDNCIEWSKTCLPKKSDLKKILFHNILNMINPDVQVKIGNNVYKCHRIVLQCYSTFFASKTSPQVEVSEASVPGEVFLVIYQWMIHVGTDSYRLLRRDNILLIFKAAQYLRIKELEDQCWAFIDNGDIFCEDKAFLLYLEARKLNNKVVMELMVPRIQRFFLTLVSSKEFIDFSVGEVCTFLESNYICVHCEEEVFMAGVRWLRHDWSQRKKYAVQVMGCIRFGLLNLKLLLSMKKDKSSPEFKSIINIPEIMKMADDGLSIQILESCLVNESPESIEKSKKNMNLVDPIPRNWAGTGRCYESYSEFIKDLSHYRSKQRLEIKNSRIKMQMERVEKDDFLSSAVLPPETQLKIRRLHADEMEPMDWNMLRDSMGQDIAEDSGRSVYNPCGTASGKRQFNYYKNLYNVEEKPRNLTRYRPSLEEQDIAARKIQKAYRQHSSKTRIKSSYDIIRDEAARKIQRAYRKHSSKHLSIKKHDGNKPMYWRSRSDPSLPIGITKSSPHPTGTYKNNLLPLPAERETVFVFGGSNPYDDGDQNGYYIFYYHIDCNEWRKCAEMPEPRHYHSVAFFRGKIYVAGGKHPSRVLTEPGAISSKVWRYDPLHMAWSRIKDMLYARRSFGLVACNNKLYVVGGRNEDDRIMSNVEKFDTVSNSWVAVAQMHLARAGAAVSEFKGKVWVAGGLVSDNNIATNSVEYYNCQNNMWVKCTSLRFTLAYGVMVPVNNRVFLVGGAVGLQESTLHGSGKQIDVWDQESETWCLAAMMSKPRHAHTAVFLQGTSPEAGYMFILGGMSTRHQCVTNHVECWRVKDEQWIIGMAPLPSAMSGAAALVLPSKTFG